VAETIQLLLTLSLFSSIGLRLTLITFTHHREGCLGSVLELGESSTRRTLCPRRTPPI